MCCASQENMEEGMGRENINDKVESSQGPVLVIEFLFFLKLFHNVIHLEFYFRVQHPIGLKPIIPQLFVHFNLLFFLQLTYIL